MWRKRQREPLVGRGGSGWIAAALLVVFVSLLAKPAAARPVPPRFWTETFLRIASQYVAVPGLDLEVRDVSVRPTEVDAPDGRLGFRLLSPAKDLAPGRRSLAIMLTVDGRDVAPVRLVGTIGLFRQVVCVERRLGRGTVLRREDLVLVRKNVAALGENPVLSFAAAVGRRLSTSRPAGAVLYESMLEEPPLVRRNDRVTIVANSGRVRITAPGLVRAPGRRGEMVPVKNLVSRKVIHARVRDAHTVEVVL